MPIPPPTREIARPSMAIAAPTAPRATRSAARGPKKREPATSPVAARTGMTIASASESMSALDVSELVGVEGSEAAVSLDGEGEEQSHDDRFDDDVGEGQRLDDRVDHLATAGDVREDRRRRIRAVADGKEQDVGRRLHDRHADDELNEVAAADDAEEAGEEEVPGDAVGENAHRASSPPLSRRRSSSSERIASVAPKTSSPTDTLASGIVPPDQGRANEPRSTKFCRYVPAMRRPPRPISAKPAAPRPSASSRPATGSVPPRRPRT